ncbi:Pre-mRNA-splicing factor CLF1 [Cyberlindnera fabianii]|uniref:Pre-mRNA-splicing factor CLF1 n=1 Tax=Cyberlindnera fabianii TaxID=36022 RepID=A0A1V2LDK1_CYBFA|nr:Pre-mRNA-splicing factor CLF1 [Cyberlindnera fabianii]
MAEEKHRERNKAPAELQITAEQILLEAYEHKSDPLNKTKVKIADLEELQEFQRRTRQGYEDALRRNRLDFGQWMRYAQFEIDQKDLRRARSIFERALEINPHHVPLWIRYIDSEIKTRNINHARNLFDRAVTLLPRVDKLWFRYVQTEEILQNINGTRHVFKRWMQWEPDTPAWDAYVNFEKRYDELDNVRKIYNQYVIIHPTPETWLKWTRFEEDYGESSTVREVFTAAIDTLQSEKLIAQFAKWEGSQKEWERARAIFKFGLIKFPKSTLINEELTHFEKQYGDKDGIEDSILLKRKQKYESELEQDPLDYDTWWAYLSLLDDYPIQTRREAFENAVAHTPTSLEKVHWKRYIFLWIKYAIFEELYGDVESARSIYKRATKITPKQFTFSKLWILYSNFEIRHGDLSQARKLLGFSIGKYPKQKTFRHYIALEIKLKEFDRVRKIYEKNVETFPQRADVWIEFAELESELNDLDRARAIFEIALDAVTTGENALVWEKYVEFEVDLNEYERARAIYQKMLEKKLDDARAWIKCALFELTVPTEKQMADYQRQVEESGDDELEFEFAITDEAKTRAREVFEKALRHFKKVDAKEKRVVMFEALKQFESTHGDDTSQEKLEKRLPTVVKKKKTLEDGTIKEYYDYIFPDDQKMSKFLEMAKKWKKQ